MIRDDVIQQPLVVRDQYHGSVGIAQAVDARGNDLEGIDVQPGIGLVQNRKFRLEHQHLQDFIALFLAARESFVDPAGQKRFAHLHELHFLSDERQKLIRIDLRLAGRFALGIQRGFQQVDVVDAWNFHRILESEKQPGARAFLGAHRQQIATLEHHGPASHFVILTAGQDLSQRALAGAVRSHDGVNLACVDRKIDAVEYFFARDAGG